MLTTTTQKRTSGSSISVLSFFHPVLSARAKPYGGHHRQHGPGTRSACICVRDVMFMLYNVLACARTIWPSSGSRYDNVCCRPLFVLFSSGSIHHICCRNATAPGPDVQGIVYAHALICPSQTLIFQEQASGRVFEIGGNPERILDSSIVSSAAHQVTRIRPTGQYFERGGSRNQGDCQYGKERVQDDGMEA